MHLQVPTVCNAITCQRRAGDLKGTSLVSLFLKSGARGFVLVKRLSQ